MKALRSFASVILSYIVVFGIVFASDPVLARLFPGQYVSGKVPPLWLIWMGTVVFMVASVLGGWLCVRIAPANPRLHLLILFLVGEVAGIVSTVANWGRWPHWNSVVWLAVWPLCLWIGGRSRLVGRPMAASLPPGARVS